MRMRALSLLLVSLLLFPPAPASAAPRPQGEACQKEKTKERPKRAKKKVKKKKLAPGEVEPGAPAPEVPATTPVPSPAPPIEVPAEGTAPLGVEPVVATSERKLSTITPGAPSRWSNAGAMAPIESEVPITAPLPERAIPVEPGAPTPGQRLISTDDLLTAHLSFSGEHLTMVRQEDLDLIRARATISYERIFGSDFGVHLDAEYRYTAAGPRPTDRAVNALYLSYGLTDFRREDGPDFGIAAGRLAVREAGYATADGAAIRYRLSPELKLGVFGGFTPNPYNYNWLLRRSQELSTNWIIGGLFGGARLDRFFADFAAVVTYARVAPGGLDRIYAFVDAGYQLSDALDAFLTGWIDVLPNGMPLQSVELMGLWTPTAEIDLRLSAGRYATLIYAVSDNLSFPVDPLGNTLPTTDAANQPIAGLPVDQNGAPITAYDQALQVAAYYSLAMRGGYRLDPFTPFVSVEALIRDTSGSATNARFAALRLLPAGGLTYRNPDLFDAGAQLTGIIDSQTERKAIFQLSLSRGFYGFTAGGDIRAFFGGVGALDGGLSLDYELPRSLMPGRLLFRTMLRYFREDVTIPRAADRCLLLDPAQTCLLQDAEVLPLVPLQEGFTFFAGVDWRL